MDVSAMVYNLFDTRYAFPSAGEFLQEKIEQDGRTLRVKLTYRF
jgi:iron complex outermembrane receptor protein